jgi:hypothetical protein
MQKSEHPRAFWIALFCEASSVSKYDLLLNVLIRFPFRIFCTRCNI